MEDKIKKDIIYQDVWINGKLEQKGTRECQKRYQIIKNKLEELKLNKFTVIDYGGNLGYFSIRLVEDFNCESLIVEGHCEKSEEFKQKLEWIVNQQKQKEKIKILGTYIKDVNELKEVDLIIALRIIHHHNNPREQLEKLLKKCKYIILQLPNPKEPSQKNNKDMRIHNGKIYFQDHNKFLEGLKYEKLGDVEIFRDRGLKSPIYIIHGKGS